MRPKVSIVVPIYNSRDFLERCVASIAEQTYTNLEVILIDDGSSDDSLKVCKILQKSDSRIIVIAQKNKGVSSARNLGIDSATGDYITFVDSDDWLEKDAIAKMVQMMADNRVDCVRTHYVINTGDEELPIRPSMRLTPGLISKEAIAPLVNDLLLAKDNCYVMLLLIKKSVLDTYKIRFSKELSMMEDVVFYCELLSKLERLYISEQSTYHYFWNQNSASKSINRLVENAKSTIQVSTLLDEQVRKTYPRQLDVFDIGAIHATHLSLITSRILTSTRRSKTLTLRDVKCYIDSIHTLPGFHELITSSNIDSLKKHLRLSVYFVIKKRYLLFYIILRLRIVASALRDSFRSYHVSP